MRVTVSSFIMGLAATPGGMTSFCQLGFASDSRLMASSDLRSGDSATMIDDERRKGKESRGPTRFGEFLPGVPNAPPIPRDGPPNRPSATNGSNDVLVDVLTG